MSPADAVRPTGGGYPSPPWRLQGQAFALLWSLPAGVAVERLPRGLTPLIRKGRSTVVTGWVDYQPGGVLSYREMLAAVPVLHGGRPGLCITDIWVDSPVSLQGGRELWSVPKELAAFDTADGGMLGADGVRLVPTTGPGTRPGAHPGPAAQASWRPGRRLPGRWPSRLRIIQHRDDGELRRSRLQGSAAVELGRASMEVDPTGPLGYLAQARLLRGIGLRDFRLAFGL